MPCFVDVDGIERYEREKKIEEIRMKCAECMNASRYEMQLIVEMPPVVSSFIEFRMYKYTTVFTLLEWYLDHLYNDFFANENNKDEILRVIKEFERLGEDNYIEERVGFIKLKSKE